MVVMSGSKTSPSSTVAKADKFDLELFSSESFKQVLSSLLSNSYQSKLAKTYIRIYICNLGKPNEQSDGVPADDRHHVEPMSKKERMRLTLVNIIV